MRLLSVGLGLSILGLGCGPGAPPIAQLPLTPAREAGVSEPFAGGGATNLVSVAVYFVTVPEPLLAESGIASLFAIRGSSDSGGTGSVGAAGSPLTRLKTAFPQVGFTRNTSNFFAATAPATDARAWIASLSNEPNVEVSAPLRVQCNMGGEYSASVTSSRTFVFGANAKGPATANLSLGVSAQFSLEQTAVGPLLLSTRVAMSEFLGYSPRGVPPRFDPDFRETCLSSRALLNSYDALLLGTECLTNQAFRIKPFPVLSRIPGIGGRLTIKRRETKIFRYVVVMVLEPAPPAAQ